MDETQMLALMVRFRKAYAKADKEALKSVTSDDFTWHQHEGHAPTGRVLDGIEALLSEIERRAKDWQDVRYENMVERAAGNDLLVQTFTISGLDCGTPFHADVVDLYPVRDGQITRKDTYWKYQNQD
ncbi:MAG: nuclear transport factor 2 family protein [Pseudomonadota bacterium]